MTERIPAHRRASDGTLIVRASLVAVGLAASVGLQLAQPEPEGVATWTVNNPSMLCTVDADGSSFGFQ